MPLNDLEFEIERKSNGVAYLLALLFGIVFAHRFYLGMTKSALVLASLAIVGIVLGFIVGDTLNYDNLLNAPAEWRRWAFTGGRLLFALIGMRLIFDLLFMPKLVKEANRKLLQNMTDQSLEVNS